MPDPIEPTVNDADLEVRIAGLVEKQIAAALEKLPKPEPAETAPKSADDILAMLGLDNLQADAAKSIEGKLQEHFKAVQRAAEMKYLQQLSLVNRKREMAELAQRLTGGNDETPRGIPAEAGKLAEMLLSLPETQLKFWTDLLSAIQKDGLTVFSELGSGRQPKGVTPLPSYVAADLDSGKIKLEDLSNPTLAPSLGDLSQYDLSKWKK